MSHLLQNHTCVWKCEEFGQIKGAVFWQCTETYGLGIVEVYFPLYNSLVKWVCNEPKMKKKGEKIVLFAKGAWIQQLLFN